MRGDGPGWIDSWWRGEQAPPHARGWTHQGVARRLFAPRAAGRSEIVPVPPEVTPGVPRGSSRVPARLPWADLLRRVFLVDILCCTRCGGRRRILEAVTEPAAAARILSHLGLDPQCPSQESARAPPEDLDQAS